MLELLSSKTEKRCCNAYASLLFLFYFAWSFVETGLEFVEDLLLGILEGLLETLVESNLSGGSDSLFLTASLGSLLLKGSNAGDLAGSQSLLFGGSECLGGGVESVHSSLVGERILLAFRSSFGVDALQAEFRLDLVRVDDSGEVSTGHQVSSKLEATLLDCFLSIGTKDVIELLEGVLGEDNESTEVATWSELEEVQSGDGANIDTGEVSSGALDSSVVVAIDNEGSLAEGEATTSHFTFAGSVVLVVTNASEVTSETEVAEALEEGGGLLSVEVINNERKLGHIINLVASGHDERTAGSGSES